MQIIKTMQNAQIAIKKGYFKKSLNPCTPKRIMRQTDIVAPPAQSKKTTIQRKMIKGENLILKQAVFGEEVFFIF